MNRSRGPAEYQALAQFRFLIRQDLNNTEKAARSVGLEPQQYFVLLALHGLAPDREGTISSLAERLQIQQHSVVELINRMEKGGLCRRERSKRDRRHVMVHLTTRGERLLSRLVQHRIAELRVSAPALTRALQAVLAAAAHEPRFGRRKICEGTAHRQKQFRSRWAELSKALESTIIPTLRKQKGFQDQLVLVGQNANEVFAISLWDRRGDAEA